VGFSSRHVGGCVSTIEKENSMRFKKQWAAAVAATGMAFITAARWHVATSVFAPPIPAATSATAPIVLPIP
jgi:hypothetical protein